MKFEIIYDENEMDERYPDIDLPEGYYGDCYKSGWMQMYMLKYTQKIT